jgi:hypothetical protein
MMSALPGYINCDSDELKVKEYLNLKAKWLCGWGNPLWIGNCRFSAKFSLSN